MAIKFKVKNAANVVTETDNSGFTESTFLASGVESLTLKSSANASEKIKILPAFDSSFDVSDPKFKESYTDFREEDFDDANDAFKRGWSPWFSFVKVYHMVGPGYVSFTSPSTIAPIAEDLGLDPSEIIDPIDILRRAFNKDEVLKQKYILQKVKKNQKDKIGESLLPPKTSRAIFNGLQYDQQQGVWTPKSKIMILSYTGMMMFLRKLVWPLNRTDKPLVEGSKWEDYLFGDPTDPQNPLFFFTNNEKDPAKEGDGGSSYGVHTLAAHTRENKLPNAEVLERFGFAYDPNTLEGKQILQSRHLLIDDATLDIWEPEKIIDFLVNLAQIPYEILDEHLGARFDIPKFKTAGTTTTSVPSETIKEKATATPPPPPLPSATSTDLSYTTTFLKATEAGQVLYTINGLEPTAVTIPLATSWLEDADTLNNTLVFSAALPEASSNWVKLSVFVQKSKNMAPPPPPIPAVPTVPTVPQTVEDTEDTDDADVDDEEEQVHLENKLTPEEQKRLQELTSMLENPGTVKPQDFMKHARELQALQKKATS